MAEGRMLKKVISTSKKLAEVETDSARLLWTWMIPHADIEGRLHADPFVLKGMIVPRIKSFTPKKIEKCLNQLNSVGLIKIYRANGEKYLEIVKFSDFQQLRADREAESKIPPSTAGEILLPSNSRLTPAKDKLSKDKLSKVKTKSPKNIATASGKPPAPWKDRLNKDLQEVIDYAHSKGFSLQGSKAWNRKTAYNLLRTHDPHGIPLGVERVKNLIDLALAVRDERYAPQCNDFVALSKRWQDLMAFGDKQMKSGRSRIG